MLKDINPSILIEGEIGDIGTGSRIHDAAPDFGRGLTDPEQAKAFVEATGIHILAPAVGNMHGMLRSMVEGKTRKHLDIERIAAIKRAHWDVAYASWRVGNGGCRFRQCHRCRHKHYSCEH
ncbi:fructose/tagatose bisphosphate aldolase [Bradyrhizobium sp. S3.14.4]